MYKIILVLLYYLNTMTDYDIHPAQRERRSKNEGRVLYSSSYWSQNYNMLPFALNLALLGNAVLTALGDEI